MCSWTARKGERTAESRARVLPGVGLELRILVDGELVWSRLVRLGGEVKLLGHLSERCREDFEKLGWLTDIRG